MNLLQLFHTAATCLRNNIEEQISAERLVDYWLVLKSCESSGGTRNGVIEDRIDVCLLSLK